MQRLIQSLLKKFSDELIYKKNLPSNTSSRSLYNIAEKLDMKPGGQMLKGIEKTFMKTIHKLLIVKKR